MDSLISILQEALSCELMDTQNISKIILEYTGVYKTYKAYDFQKVRGYFIEEE